MPSRHVQLADAVVARLQAFAAGLPSPVPVERSWRSRLSTDDLAQSRIIVAPDGRESEDSDRGSWIESARVAVHVVRCVTRPNETTEVDALDSLAEAVADHLRDASIGPDWGAPAEIAQETLVDIEALDVAAVYRGSILLTYRSIVARTIED
jgi:hypothetical protein